MLKRREYNDGAPKYQIEIVTIGRLLFFFQEYKCDLKTVPFFWYYIYKKLWTFKFKVEERQMLPKHSFLETTTKICHSWCRAKFVGCGTE